MVMSKKAPPAIIGPGRMANLPTGRPGRVVHAEDAVAGEAVEQAVLDHRLGAAAALLGRLEDEMHGAVEVARLGEVAGGAQQHRGVAVVAAGMHAARVLRAVGEGVGSSIGSASMSARSPMARGSLPVAARRPRRSCRCRVHLEAELLQLARHDVGGALLLEAELGMRMQVAPPRGHLVVKAADAIEGLHAHGLGLLGCRD